MFFSLKPCQSSIGKSDSVEATYTGLKKHPNIYITMTYANNAWQSHSKTSDFLTTSLVKALEYKLDGIVINYFI
jgi:hypothetical protein